MTPREEDVFDGEVPHWLGRAIPVGGLGLMASVILWQTAKAIVQGGAGGEHLARAAIGVALLAILSIPFVWMERHRVHRLAIFPDGFAGITMGGRRFAMSWPDVRETSAEFRVRMAKLEPWRRAVRLDTTTGPLLLTDCLPHFDVLVARIQAATPHAFHHALPTWFERLLLNAKPPLVR